MLKYTREYTTGIHIYVYICVCITYQGFIQVESFWGEAPGSGCGFIYFSIRLSQVWGGGGSFSPPPPPMKPCLPYVEHLHVCQLCYDRLNLPFSLPRGLYPGKEEILCVYFSARFTRSLIDERITNPSATRFSSKFLHHMFKLCVEFPLKAHHLNTHMLSSQWLPE